MHSYIVLLRGVMPSGKNRIPKMAELREAIEAAEFVDVTTYIQSGNIILRSPHSPEQTSTRIAEIIRAYCGAELGVITTTAEELRAHLASSPFGADYLEERVFYPTTMDTIDPERLAALCEEDYGAEELRVVAGRLYLYIPTDASRSKLSNNFVEKKLKITATTRNRKTLARLIELAEALPST